MKLSWIWKFSIKGIVLSYEMDRQYGTFYAAVCRTDTIQLIKFITFDASWTFENKHNANSCCCCCCDCFVLFFFFFFVIQECQKFCSTLYFHPTMILVLVICRSEECKRYSRNVDFIASDDEGMNAQLVHPIGTHRRRFSLGKGTIPRKWNEFMRFVLKIWKKVAKQPTWKSKN